MDKSAFLKTTDLFSDIPETLLSTIGLSMEELSEKAGAVIFKEGDEGDAVYLVVEGTLGLVAGGVRLIGCSKGECVGEFALIDNAPRSASAVADTDVRLLVWRRKEFQRALIENGEVTRSVFKLLTGKLRQNVAVQVEAALERERWRQDLKRAREIQQAMLPTQDLATGSVSVSGYCRPAAHVGGDYFDYVLLGEDKVGIIVADVMGHGFYAGLLMAMAKSCLHTQVTIDDSPAAVMEAMNQTVFHSVQSGLLMSCCYIVIDPRNDKMAYTNAGHPYPFHCSGKTGEMERLTSTDTLLGFPGFEGLQFTVEERKWEKGDLLVLFTDGVPEAEDEQGKMFGDTRLESLILANKDQSPAQVKERILEALLAHASSTAEGDDVTLVVAKSTE
jgi:serine phosphatase RsbU (regulator of sigma subunit)